MNRRLYVGNLSFSTQEQTLEQTFAAYGPVESVRLVRDKATGQSRGFGFVEMGSDEGARAAIEQLNESQLEGRRLTVNEARPQEPRGDRPFARPGGGGGGGRRREPRW
ncbi:MAG: RNA-binding protein [Acidobacteria bacterium]|nr:RNA-binding protein [Acidobacteriota bacterium]